MYNFTEKNRGTAVEIKMANSAVIKPRKSANNLLFSLR